MTTLLPAQRPRPLVRPPAPGRPGSPASGLLLIGLLLIGLVAAVLIRCAIGGAGVARSTPAALVFAGLLTGLAVIATPRRAGASALSRLPRRSRLRFRVAGRPPAARAVVAVAVGLAGAVVLCVPAVIATLLSAAPVGSGSGWASTLRPFDGFLGWAAVVTLVASAEEVFLRGVLFRLLEPFGLVVAVAVPAVAFAALHLPLYGWGAMPLDLAVGVWLGALRAASGSVVAPAVAHTVADWAAYWLA